MATQVEYDNDPNIICLNDAVILHSNRKGIVRYISDKKQHRIAVGIELTEPNTTNCNFGDISKVFKCKPNHGILVPLSQIARKIMPEELLIQLQLLSHKVNKYHKQIDDLRSKLIQNENQYASWITTQLLSSTNHNNNHRHRRQHHKNHRHRDYISHRNGHNTSSSNTGTVRYHGSSNSTETNPMEISHILQNEEIPVYTLDPSRNDITAHNERHKLHHKQQKHKQHRRRHHQNEELSGHSHTYYNHGQHVMGNKDDKRRNGIDYLSSDLNGIRHHHEISMSLNLENEHRVHGIPMVYAMGTKPSTHLEYSQHDKHNEISVSVNSMNRKTKLQQQPSSSNTSPSRGHKKQTKGKDHQHGKQRKDKHRRRSGNNYRMMATDTIIYPSNNADDRDTINDYDNNKKTKRKKSSANLKDTDGQNNGKAMIILKEYEEV